MTPLVFIVVLNWNGLEDSCECLRSLRRLTYERRRLVFVDNASTDGSPEMISQLFPEVELIRNERNLGFAGGCNVGIRFALAHGADYVWLLNNDTVCHPDALTELVARMRAQPGIGMCGSTLVYHDDRDRIQALAGATYNRWLGTTRHLGEGLPRVHGVSRERVEKKLDYVVAASLLVSRQLVEQSGMMSEDYFLYYEDLDWSTRAKRQFKLAYAPLSIVFHKEGGSTGGSNRPGTSKSRLSDLYSIRSRLLYTRKFHPAALVTVYLALLGTLFRRVLRGQWDRLGPIIRIALNPDSRSL